MFIPINLTLSIYPTPLLAMVQFGPMACFLEIAEHELELYLASIFGHVILMYRQL